MNYMQSDHHCLHNVLGQVLIITWPKEWLSNPTDQPMNTYIQPEDYTYHFECILYESGVDESALW